MPSTKFLSLLALAASAIAVRTRPLSHPLNSLD